MGPRPTSDRKARAPHAPAARIAVVAVALALLLVVLLRNAWLVEDAYITFRTVDNLVSGHGATWNAAERVQAFTHPLWMLLMSALYGFTHDVYTTSIAVSTLLTLAAVAVLGLGVASTAASAAIAAAVLLVSKAFVDFSVSGLENPLTHLLVVLFLWTWWRRPPSARRLLELSVWAGLAAVNRMDVLVFLAPALAAEAAAVRGRRAVGALALGFLPFIAWEAFALFYYGFPFPNPAYAKLNAGIAHADLAAQGLRYLRNSVAMDPPTLAAVVAGLAFGFARRGDRRAPIATGTLLYAGYVVWIGGDFMSGRFLALPLLGAAALIARASFRGTAPRVAAAVALVALVAASRYAPPFSGPGYRLGARDLVGPDGIADERGYYFQATGLFRADRGRGVDAHPDAIRGRALRDGGTALTVGGNIGYLGFFAGPRVHIVDGFALADPLLARLPTRSINWRVGHYVRDLPAGYVESLEGGTNVIQDARIRAVQDGIARVTRAPLLDPGRLREIWRFNTGGYRRELGPLFESRRLQERGSRELARGRSADAAATLKASLRLDPGRSASWYLLSEAERNRGALEASRDALFRAIQLVPDRYDDGMLALAAAYQERQAYLPAAALCESYLTHHPGSAQAHASLGLSYDRLGMRDEAVAQYRRALEIEPGRRAVAARLRTLVASPDASSGQAP